MDLARLRRIIDALIEDEGEDAPVAVYYITARDVQETLQHLRIPEGLRMILGQVLKKCCRNCSQTRAIRRLMISFCRISRIY